ncbi:hypothetical protein [Methylobacterium sp. WL19]|uniref:hypothetical protein n=1 Tax=Methylobacterium sp. WL19 TaxID=2603896 RepID=UPI0011CB4753|nr:hypothetical protein [Methylobacterium sp. WL19]TXN33874.1 hypothetical protein FV220_00025 [Methylobacterium sp. WL19]
MALSGLFYRAAVEVPSGIPTGVPGQAIVEDAVRKIAAADSLYAPLFIASLAVIALLGWLLYRAGIAKTTELERVVTALERSNGILTALDAMKGSITALNTAVHDLAREAEGEAKDGRHGQANILQIVGYNNEIIKRLETRMDRLLNRGGDA